MRTLYNYVNVVNNASANYLDVQYCSTYKRPMGRRTGDYPYDNGRTYPFASNMFADGTEGWRYNVRLCDRSGSLESSDHKHRHAALLVTG
ncbi:MAG: hypothetical protein M1305_02225 [Candidatus Marsarchaeota archaeon]|nr:hypothetical protein [Candidatus Marsarchaeota archaeon]